MKDSILTLAKQLIAIPSEANRPEAIQEILLRIKQELREVHCTEFVSRGITSLLFSTVDAKQHQFKIVLNGHADVVPAVAEQYQPFEKDNRLYGRGAYDMKTALAIMILVFKEVADNLPYPIGLQIVTDEERGGENGTKYQIEQGVTADFVLGGENSGLKINNEAKGSLDIEIVTRGVASHAAYPWRGESAVLKMVQVLEKLQELFPQPESEAWQTTATVIRLDTPNESLNSVPHTCKALVSIRYIPEDKRSFIEVIKNAMPFPIDIQLQRDFSCEYTDVHNPFVQKLQQSIEQVTGKPTETLKTHGGSDLRYYHDRKIPGVNLGLIGGNHHAQEEWVDLENVEEYFQILKSFLLAIQ